MGSGERAPWSGSMSDGSPREKNLPLIPGPRPSVRSANASRISRESSWETANRKLEELKREHPEFIFAGVLRGEALAEHYASADLFIFPSITETFGNVTLEAMASGLGVVAYDYAAARQHIVSGENGFTAPFDDREAFLDLALEAAGRNLTLLREEARASARKVRWRKW